MVVNLPCEGKNGCKNTEKMHNKLRHQSKKKKMLFIFLIFFLIHYPNPFSSCITRTWYAFDKRILCVIFAKEKHMLNCDVRIQYVTMMMT